MKLEIQIRGRMSFTEAWEVQHRMVEERIREEICDTLLLLEHPPVITRGKRGSDKDLRLSREILQRDGVEIFDIERGGETTYHGPGQLVGYIIINLYNHQRQLKRFVHTMEQLFIDYLERKFNISAGRDPDYIGVWVNKEKITAMGIALKRSVTMHGFAFNVNTDLSHFSWIIPCGITDKGVTSLQKLTGKVQDMDRVARDIGTYFAEIYKYDEVIWREKQLF